MPILGVGVVVHGLGQNPVVVIIGAGGHPIRLERAGELLEAVVIGMIREIAERDLVIPLQQLLVARDMVDIGVLRVEGDAVYLSLTEHIAVQGPSSE